MIKKFEQYNESLRDKMTPVSSEKVEKMYQDKLEKILSGLYRNDVIRNLVDETTNYNNSDVELFNNDYINVLQNIVNMIDKEDFEKFIKILLEKRTKMRWKEFN